MAFFALAGVSLYHLRLTPPDDPSHIVHLAESKGEVRLEGVVESVAARSDGSTAVDLEIGTLFEGQQSKGVTGRLRLYLGSGVPVFDCGQHVRFRCRLRRPRPFGTPGEFDFGRHLAARDIYVTAYLESAADVVPLALPLRKGLGTFVARHRQRIAHLIERSVEPECVSLVRALIIGDKKGVSPVQRDVLARSGLSHLFSVSGMHLGLVAGFFYLLLLPFYRRSERLLLWQPPQRALPVALLFPLWGYVLLTGLALPTQRAFLCLAAGAGLLMFSRFTSLWRLLMLAALVMLSIEPLALFTPSFQLSFAGAAGIIAFVPRYLPRSSSKAVIRFLSGLFLTTLAATLATLPLVMWHFHLLVPAGMLSNLVAVPLVGFVALPLGLAGAAFSFFSLSGSSFLFYVCGKVLEACYVFSEHLIRFPFLKGWSVFLPPGQLFGVALVAMGILLTGRKGSKFLPVGVLSCGLLVLSSTPLVDNRPSLTLFSVGQGASSLLRLSDGRHYLIDGGGLYGDRFDVGERLLMPALASLGVSELEAVVLSHDHPDHSKGLPFVLSQLPVKVFLCRESPSCLNPDVRFLLESRKVPLQNPTPGWTELAKIGPDEELVLFSPEETVHGPNDRSLVLFYRYGRNGLLLTGDLESEGVKNFLKHVEHLSVSILILPHHGSRHSQSERLLDAFNPGVALVSVGYNNSYRLPSDVLLAELERRRIPLYRTDQDGTLRVVFEGDTFRVKRWKKGLFR